MNYQTRTTQPESTQPQSEIRNPQSAIQCAATTQAGTPCQAHPVPGSDFCPFHHPDHTAAVAEGRSKGGAAPRRVRRVPIVLDHLHIAAFMSEILVEAMNHPEAVDSRRLNAVTNLSRTLLNAVGTPKQSFYFHFDRRETPVELPHLVRHLTETAPTPADPPVASADAGQSSDRTPCRLAVDVPKQERLGAEFIGMKNMSFSACEPVEFLLADSSTCDLDEYRNAGNDEAASPAYPSAPVHDGETDASAAADRQSEPASALPDEDESMPIAPSQREEPELAPDRWWTGDPGTEELSCEEMVGDDPSFDGAGLTEGTATHQGSSQWLEQQAAPLSCSSFAQRPVLIPLKPFRGVEPQVGYLSE